MPLYVRMCRTMTRVREKACKCDARSATTKVQMRETLDPAQGRRSNRPGKLSGKRTGLRNTLESGAHAPADGITISGARTEGVTRRLREPQQGLHVGRICAERRFTRCISELGGKHGAVRGLRHAGAIPDGRDGRAHCTRATHAGLFDVSHMGQVILRGPDAALALERLVPVDLAGLAEGRQRYAMFTNDAGGILDDLMVANRGDHLFLVVNAACKAADVAHLRAKLPELQVDELHDRALLALQGPRAEAALDTLLPGVAAMRFMDVGTFDWQGHALWVSRSGYTGEDGYRDFGARRAGRRLLPARCWTSPMSRPSGLARATACGWKRGCACMGTTSTKTTSPVAAGLVLGHPESPARGRGARRRLSRGRPHLAGLVRRAADRASACAPRAARRCARARCCGTRPRRARHLGR